MNGTILASLNKHVNTISAEIIEQLPGDYKLSYSYDAFKDQPERVLKFTLEFLNSIDAAGSAMYCKINSTLLTPLKILLNKIFIRLGNHW